MSKMCQWIVLVLWVCVTGCHESEQSATDAVAASMGDASQLMDMMMSEPDSAGQMNPESMTIEIPMRTRSSEDLRFIVTADDIREEAGTLRTILIRQPLNLLARPEFPSSFTVGFLAPYFAFGQCTQTSGSIELMDVMGDGISVRQLDPFHFIIEDLVAGTGVINATAIFRPTVSDIENCGDLFEMETEVRFDMQFAVSVVTPVRLRNVKGPECSVLLSDSPVRMGLELGFVDANGNAVSGLNVERTHPVNLSVSAPSGMRLEDTDAGVYGITLGPRGGDMVITAPFGDPITYTIEDGSGITDWSVAWSIAGVAGGGIYDLEDGATYSGPWGRTSNRVMPGLQGPLVQGGTELCALSISPSWFSMSSETPETCQVDEVPIFSGEIEGMYIEQSAELIADGTCRLRLIAPKFNGGQGAESTIEVTVEDVENMIDLDN